MASGRALLKAFAVALLVLTTACGARPTAPPRASVLPAVPVRALDGSPQEVSTALRGRPAMIALWATWCDACRDELPALARVDAWARGRGAAVVGVAVGESISDVTRFTRGAPPPYLVLVDETYRFADALGERRVPTTLVVDGEGRVVFAGEKVDDEAVAALERALEPRRLR